MENLSSGQRIVVTGATSGIGREIAASLTTAGAEVVLACRDAERGRQVAAEIEAATGGRRPRVMRVDTASQASIKLFARDYEQRYGRLDVLVNNAGVVRPDRESTPEGVELTFATNVIGYFLMTQELLGSLRVAPRARVVNVASTYASDLDLDDLQFERRPYDGLTAYAQSKACDRMLTWALARRVGPDGITANALAPGLMTTTGLYRDLSADTRQYLEEQPARSIAGGADTAIWLASSPEVEGITGRFYEQRSELPCEFRDEQAEEQLWTVCEGMTAIGSRLTSSFR